LMVVAASHEPIVALQFMEQAVARLGNIHQVPRKQLNPVVVRVAWPTSETLA